MYFAKKVKNLLPVIILVIAGAVSLSSAGAAYLTTNRDTKLPPDKVTYDIVNTDEFEKLYETDTMIYYFREDRDVFAVQDKRNGYTWKTGLDIPFGADIDMQVAAAETKEEAEKLAVPQEAQMATTYTGIANSILTLEYYESGTIKNVSSASRDLVESELVTLNENPATRRLDVNFMNLEVKVKVYITFEEASIRYEIKKEDITGKGSGDVMAVLITPFLGASGGKTKYYNPDTQMYDIVEEKYMIPGYIFVPDGSGSLIRFQNNSANFTMYYGDVYGPDPAQNEFNNEFLIDSVPLKNPVMPVFGVAHGDGQAAFVAYADKGAEYMQIAFRPEENLTAYNFVYPRFVYNVKYWQVYNNRGEGYYTVMDTPNQFDIDMTYTFLSGDGSDGTPAADYTGMAVTYREHLIEEGVLTEQPAGPASDVPIRLDFIMSDMKKGVVGMDEVVVTNTGDVRDILTEVAEDMGITNINSGLYGWQQGGETLAKPGSSNYYGRIGSKKEFKSLITEFADQDIDISLARDYTMINREMMSYYSNAVRHVNSWYLEVDKAVLLPANVPVTLYGYADPKRSAQWFETQFKRQSGYAGSMTVEGISNRLLSNYNSDGVVTTVTEAIDLYRDIFRRAKEEVKLNFEAPNLYLWEYTDRFLQCPAGTSQYVFETDAVPFLQMVLHGTMEVYAPYANFSFYTQKDILKMIDYNMSPAFILSKEPSHYLAATPSADLYSTEFEQYKGLIDEVYSQINAVLSQVAGYEWTDRTVPMNGVIINTYQRDGRQKKVIINYTDDSVTVGQDIVAPLSAAVVDEGDQ